MRKLLAFVLLFVLMAGTASADWRSGWRGQADTGTVGSAPAADPFDGTLEADLETGNTPYSIDGGTNGIALDPDNDNVNEVTIDANGVLTATGFTTGAGNEPLIAIDIDSVGDRDFWIGVVSDSGGTTAGDYLSFGTGTSLGVGTFASFDGSTFALTGSQTISSNLTVTGNIVSSTNERVSGDDDASVYIDFNDEGAEQLSLGGSLVITDTVGIQYNVDSANSTGGGKLYQVSYQDDSFLDEEVLLLAQDSYTNLVTNPGFESSFSTSGTLTIGSGWTNSGLDSGSDSASQETTIKHGGSNSQKIVADAASEGFLQTIGGHVNGNHYRFTAWAYDAGGSGTCQIQVQRGTSPFTGYCSSSTTTTDAWELLTCDYIKPETEVSVSFVARTSGNGATCYFDDIKYSVIQPTSGFGMASCNNEHAMFSWSNPVNTVIEDGEDAWNEQVVGNVTASLDTSTFHDGLGAAKFAVASGFTTGIIGSEAVTLDLRDAVALRFWVRSSVALSSGDYQIVFDDTANAASPISTPSVLDVSANTWTEIYSNVSPATAASLGSVISLGVKQVVDKGAMDFWIDNIRVVRTPLSVTATTSSVDNRDTDTKFCIYTTELMPIIKNRTGSTCELRAVTWSN